MMLSDRISRINSFGASDMGYGREGRTPIRKIGRMYTSPSIDRLNSFDRTRPLLTRTKSIFDVSDDFSKSTAFTSAPITHRNPRYQNVRTSVWRQSEPTFASGLKYRPSFHKSRPDLSSSSGYSSASSMSYSPTSTKFPDPIAVLDRRDQFFSQLNSYASPKVNRRFVPQSTIRHHWPLSTLTNDSWRPRLRERPLLANLSATIGRRSKNSRQSSGRSSKTSSTSSTKLEESISPERKDSSGIYRNRYIIKFREHNLGQTPSQRRSSITWDLPKACLNTSVKGPDDSPITELHEPDPHLEIKDAESKAESEEKESVSQGINESDISGKNQNEIKNEIVSERVADEEVVRKEVLNRDNRVNTGLSESEPRVRVSDVSVTQLVTDIINVQTAEAMPEPSGGITAALSQRALTLKPVSKPVAKPVAKPMAKPVPKPKTCDDKTVDNIPDDKAPKKKKVKKKAKEKEKEKDVVKQDETQLKDKEDKKEKDKSSDVSVKENVAIVSPNVSELKVCKDINENIVTKLEPTKQVKTSQRPTTTTTTPQRIKFRKYTFDDFNLLRVLGRGSFGKVFLAELKEHNVNFAIKCLKKHSVIEDDDIDSIMIERKVLAYGSAHPFICKLFCTFQTDSYLCFAMEWCSGGDLMFHVQKFGKFDEDKARFYASEILCAVKFMHNKGIIYRDLKLDNIMIDHKGHIRLVDFGMCQGRIYREDLLPSNFCGTPEYMAPEIIKGVKYNQSVDFWSLGVVIYEMVVGTSPFHGTDEDELLWNVCHEEVVYPKYLSENIKSLLVLLLNKNSEQRLGMATCPAGDIYCQPYFKGVDWLRVEKCQLRPPFVPELSSPSDVCYFEPYFTKETPNLTPVSDEITLSMDQTVFHGFSYTNHNMTE